jgi:transaldolase/glucose-6-phosphate isomerase
MPKNPLRKLQSFGQSIWLDYIRRGLLSSGELQHLIDEDGLSGVTSNPSIFEKAVTGNHDYDTAIRALALEPRSLQEIYEAVTVEDVQLASDLFRPIYDQTEGKDGFASLEVSPHLAYNTEGTIDEARRLWLALNRPNVFVKVPATVQGLPAIQQLTSEGINVNITLLFGLPRYREVAEAYIKGLEARKAQGKPLNRVTSVASFFLSRIDVLVDAAIEKVMEAGNRKEEMVQALYGQVAVASAKVAYQMYKEIFSTERFRTLADLGARPQRLLWASTGTKDPAYSDVKYVEPLIGPHTVNTLPVETLDAYRDHGHPELRLEEDVEKSYKVLNDLPKMGIDLHKVTQQLEEEGIQKFIKPYNSLMGKLKEKCLAALKEPVDRQKLDLGKYQASVQDRIISLEQEHFNARLWRKDPSLWKADSEAQQLIANRLGWLHLAEKIEGNLRSLSDFLTEVQTAGFAHVVHMGMGGSAMTPLVFQRTFAPSKKGLPLTVLDTTDPATILAIETSVPIAQTFFIEASKSGTTAESRAFGEYFYAKVKALKGDRAGENFAVITDPDTSLIRLGQERVYRRLFANFPDVGGRFSALSYFGLVSATLMGIDVAELLLRALRMVHACASCLPAREASGLVLGALMGELAKQGRNKVTFLTPEPLAALGLWLEQLLAESTGKEGIGLLPVAGEPVGDPSLYGEDRLFIYIRLNDEIDAALERGVASLRDSGHPVVTIEMDDRLDLGQEFFRWEIATATAGAILGINPFDEPNVQESKNNTNRLLEGARKQGRLPEENPTLIQDSLAIYAQEGRPTMAQTVARFLAQGRRGDYVAMMAYLTENPATDQALQSIRVLVRDKLHLATTVGYGPRFLHSTGQLHKGGPNTGLFLQLTADDPEDAQIPGQSYTFGVLKRAQALGDLEALRKHGRRVVRIHLGADVSQGLAALEQIVKEALVTETS